MSVFKRSHPPPMIQSNYRKYRPYVREDFCECCAYCLLHEIVAGGQSNFELDHFHPRSKQKDGFDPEDFYNIYYSCHVCNHYKSDSWPGDDLLSAGYRFVDLCKEDFESHFIHDNSGMWKALTPAGEYTEARLRLNRRHLIELRALLNQIAVLKGKQIIDWNKQQKNR